MLATKVPAAPEPLTPFKFCTEVTEPTEPEAWSPDRTTERVGETVPTAPDALLPVMAIEMLKLVVPTEPEADKPDRVWLFPGETESVLPVPVTLDITSVPPHGPLPQVPLFQADAISSYLTGFPVKPG